MYDKEIKVMEKALRKVEKKIFNRGAKDKNIKGQADFVTDKDLACEKYLRKVIKKHFPKDKILGEEFSADEQLADRTWVLDPIDGTINYMQDLPECGIQVAFFDRGETQFSFISLPKTDEFFFAKNGNGAYLNGKQIYVDKNVEIQNSIITHCDISMDNTDLANLHINFIKKTNSKILRNRCYGSACFSYGSVASSKTSAYILITNNAWDILPGMLICKEAGCYCTSTEFYGKKFSIACCNENLGKFILKNLK